MLRRGRFATGFPRCAQSSPLVTIHVFRNLNYTSKTTTNANFLCSEIDWSY